MNNCPYCKSSLIRKKSFYFVKSTRSSIRRYICKLCHKTFSSKTFSPTYYQKKSFLNLPLLKLLMSGNTQRRAARLLGCTKNTVERKFLWLATFKTELNLNVQDEMHLQIDELETIEHTKLKPLTIPLCVNSNYKIIALSVGKIRAKGHLSDISLKKYGHRDDQRGQALTELFEKLKGLKIKPISITTDAHPLYPLLIQKYFPYVEHVRIVSREHLKKKRELIYTAERKKLFDPLFALNQRIAMLRADIRRLTRRSWCTTKKIENLKHHLELYQIYNNQNRTA